MFTQESAITEIGLKKIEFKRLIKINVLKLADISDDVFIFHLTFLIINII